MLILFLIESTALTFIMIFERTFLIVHSSFGQENSIIWKITTYYVALNQRLNQLNETRRRQDRRERRENRRYDRETERIRQEFEEK